MFRHRNLHKHNLPQVHNHQHDAYGHTHGAIDTAILTTQRGIWAIKWSFFGLLPTALFQVVIVFVSGSVALLADTIHNFGDAFTAIPLGIAFMLAKWPPNKRFVTVQPPPCPYKSFL